MTELFKNFTFLSSQILQGTFCNFVANGNTSKYNNLE